MPASWPDSPGLLCSPVKAEGGMMMLMDESLSMRMPTRGSVQKGKRSKHIARPNPLQDASESIDDEELEKLAWKAMDEQNAKQTELSSSSPLPFAQMSPNIEIRKKRSPRKSRMERAEAEVDGVDATEPVASNVGSSRPSNAEPDRDSPFGSKLLKADDHSRKVSADPRHGQSVQAAHTTDSRNAQVPTAPFKESREERRVRLGLSTSRREQKQPVPAPRSPTAKTFAPSPLRKQVVATTPTPPAESSSKRRLTSLLAFSPSKCRHLPKVDFLSASVVGSKDSEEVKGQGIRKARQSKAKDMMNDIQDQSSELLRIMGKSPSPKRKSSKPSSKLEAGQNGANDEGLVIDVATERQRTEHGHEPEQDEMIGTGWDVPTDGMMHEAAGNERHFEDDQVQDEMDLSDDKESAENFVPPSALHGQEEQEQGDLDNAEPQAAAIPLAQSSMESELTQRTHQAGSSVFVQSTAKTHAEKPTEAKAVEGRKSRRISSIVEREAGAPNIDRNANDAKEPIEEDVQSSTTQHKGAIGKQDIYETESARSRLAAALSTNEPTSGRRTVVRRKASAPEQASQEGSASTRDVAPRKPSDGPKAPAGFRITSAGSLVPIATTSCALRPSRTEAASRAHVARRDQDAAEKSDQKAMAKSAKPAIQGVPAYLKRRREQLAKEEEEDMKRRLEAIRQTELRRTTVDHPGSGNANGAVESKATSQSALRRSRKDLPQALMGPRPKRQKADASSTATSQAKPFISALSARSAERSAWESRRQAREALLEAERQRAREERERVEAEELVKERQRRVHVVEPVPRDLHVTHSSSSVPARGRKKSETASKTVASSRGRQ
ncbi:unnamed protein product [Jaminaea pallidilutea]